jgi:hypothetical protein
VRPEAGGGRFWPLSPLAEEGALERGAGAPLGGDATAEARAASTRPKRNSPPLRETAGGSASFTLSRQEGRGNLFSSLSPLASLPSRPPLCCTATKPLDSHFLTLAACRLTITMAKEHLERPMKTAVNTSAPGSRPTLGLLADLWAPVFMCASLVSKGANARAPPSETQSGARQHDSTFRRRILFPFCASAAHADRPVRRRTAFRT